MEGHPNLAVYPIERRFSRTKYEWPDLSEVISNRDFDGLCKAIAVDTNIEYQSELGVLIKSAHEELPFKFDHKRFIRRFRELLTENQGFVWNERSLFGAQARAFFEVWEGGRYFDSVQTTNPNQLAMFVERIMPATITITVATRINNLLRYLKRR